jgi:hypothetical protein
MYVPNGAQKYLIVCPAPGRRHSPRQ